MEYYIGDVFLVVEVENEMMSKSNGRVVKVFSNQYGADECAWSFNERAKKCGIDVRYGVICRGLFE